jgi:hypothetical protein
MASGKGHREAGGGTSLRMKVASEAIRDRCALQRGWDPESASDQHNVPDRHECGDADLTVIGTELGGLSAIY